MINYINFKQYDLEWANKQIGKSGLLMKDFGCVVTALADLAVFYDKDTDPGRLVEQLRFTKDGLVYWKSFTKIFKDIKYIRAYNWADTSADLKTIDELLVEWPL